MDLAQMTSSAPGYIYSQVQLGISGFLSEPGHHPTGSSLSCYLLHRKANTYIHADELAECFIQAFPNILHTAEEDPFSESGTILHRAYCVRFLERFGAYFGLVTIKTEEKLDFDFNYKVQTTPLFKNILLWK